jgi:CBS domain-containing protein/sporulation protein YlmC with PRC-barrel domain
MASEVVKFSYLSEFINLPVYRVSDNKRMGRLVDLAAVTTQVYPRVTGIMVRIHIGKPAVYIPWSSVKLMVLKKRITVDYPFNGSEQQVKAAENEILISKTFLDKQIISTSGYKIVRVNDLQLLIEDQTKENTNLWVVHIDIGFKAILRRLGFLRTINAAFRWVTDRDIMDEFVSWKYVQPTATSPVRASVQLKTDASKLSEIHPADMADIIEDLGTDERIALIESLDYFSAAQTIQEMQFKNRLQIVESMEPTRLAPIINEMQVDEAVDLLDACDVQKRQIVCSLMPKEKVAELKELSKLSKYSVGSIMNTDFITAKPVETVGTVLNRIRVECEKLEMYRYAYILDEDGRLKGVISLRNLLVNNKKKLMAEVMDEQPVSVQIDTRIRRVAKLFFKYNFEAIPVVDDDDVLQGLVSYRDVITSIYPEIKEEDTI